MIASPAPNNRLFAVAVGVVAAALLTIAATTLVYSSEITAARLPMQWGLDGKPTWFGQRQMSLWGLFIVEIVGGGGMLALARVTAAIDAERADRAADFVSWAAIGVLVILAAAHIYHMTKLLLWAGLS